MTARNTVIKSPELARAEKCEPFLAFQSQAQDGDAAFWRETCCPICDVTPINSDANSGLFRAMFELAEQPNKGGQICRAIGVSPGALFESPLKPIVMAKDARGFRNFIKQAGFAPKPERREVLAA